MPREKVPLIIEIGVEVECRYTASRPAPVSFGDHDSPGFSDPGDAPEIDLLAVRVNDMNILNYLDKAELVELKDRMLDHLENQI